MVVMPVVAVRPPVPALAEVASNYQGFDGCQPQPAPRQPTVSEMQAYWTGTPFWQYYLYLPGDYGWAYCPSGISSSWIQAVHNSSSMRYGLVAIMVGPQCCATDGGRAYPYWISLNTATATGQGKTEADNAVYQLAQYGVFDATFPIVYDMEGYRGSGDNSNCYAYNLLAQCDAAVRAFIGGWIWEMHSVQSQYWVGAYGSSCDSYPENWVGASPVPDFVWISWWSRGTPSAWGYACLNDVRWNTDQRHGQYAGGHWGKVYNNVQLFMDSDCANGWVWPGAGTYGGYYNDGDPQGESGGATEDDNYTCSGGNQ
jgi:hypothetical protein